jgi:predicted RNase H-like nuclease
VRLLGVDGCRGGWLVAEAAPGPAVHDVAVVARLADAVPDGRPPADEWVCAVDMPIGLLDVVHPGGRDCDRAARRLLGPRRSTVFSPPTRAALAAHNFDAAQVHGGLTIQAWNLRHKILEVDAVATPGRPLYESHPELAFQRLHGGRPLAPKRTAGGRAQRTAIVLEAVEGASRWIAASPRLRRAGAAPDDLLDALVLCVTAGRIADGTADRVPDGTPARDAHGRPMAVWW